MFFLTFYSSNVNCLVCYDSDYFNYKKPVQVFEECRIGRSCVRYVELKNGTVQKDTIGCGRMSYCRSEGEEAIEADDEIVFYCIDCEYDKCIPESPTDEKIEPTSTSTEREVQKKTAVEDQASIFRVSIKSLFIVFFCFFT